jgi:hypothetical protein
MKQILVLSVFAVLTACGGSDSKPATDPTTAAPAATDASKPTAPAATDAVKPASTDAAKPADPAKK